MADSHTRSIRRHRIRYEIESQPRFLTFSCHHRLPLLDDDNIKRFVVESLELAQDGFGFRLHAWVIMPDHMHLVLTPRLPEKPVPPILQAMKPRVAKRALALMEANDSMFLSRITDKNGRRRFWLKGGGYDRNIRDEAEYVEKVNYVHENPVRRGLVKSPADWAWSSARVYAGMESTGPPIDRIR